MRKKMWKRVTAFIMAMVMIVGMESMGNFAGLVNVAKASTTGSLTNTNIGLSDNGKGVWNASGNVVTGEVEGTTTLVIFTSAQDGTLTITNNYTSDAILKFSYVITTSGGSCEIGGTSCTGSGDIETTLAANGTYKIKITSPKGKGAKTTINITDIELIQISRPNITFMPSAGGSFTVDGTTITGNTVLNKVSTDAYSVVATPNSGYQFAGWISNGTYKSKDANTKLAFGEDASVTALFVPSTTPVFMLESTGATYTDLPAAITAAGNSGKVILLKSGTLSAGNYTIPSGVTLLLPYAYGANDVGNETGYDNANMSYYPSSTTSSTGLAYPGLTTARLTLATENGANIIVDGGALVIGGQIGAASGGNGSEGRTTGSYSEIVLGADSKITVQNGGVLSSCGYLLGGTVEVTEGKVYEPYVVVDFNGGTYSAVMYDTLKVAPFQRYTMFNIQSKMILHANSGAELYGYCDLFGDDKHNPSLQKIVGVSDALWIGTGRIEMTYDGTKTVASQQGTNIEPYVGKTTIEFYGDANLGSLNITFSGVQILTSALNYPVPYNYELKIKSGTFTVSNDMAFLPGAELIVEEGATLTLPNGKKLLFYDGYTEKKFANTVYPSGSNLAKHYSERGRLIVNGTMNINGTFVGIVETSGEAGIINVGANAVLSYAPSGETKEELDSGAIVEGALAGENARFVYYIGKYNSKTYRGLTALINTGTGLDSMQAGKTYYGSSGTTTKESYSYWSIDCGFAEDGTYALGTKTKYKATNVTIVSNTVSYTTPEVIDGVWSTGYKITFDPNDGTGGGTNATEYIPGDEIPGPSNAVSREGYSFINWNTKADGTGTTYNVVDGYVVDGEGNRLTFGRANVTLYAQWDANSYTITFKDDDKTTELHSITQDCDTSITAPANPTKTGHQFLGWVDADGNAVTIPSTMPAGGLTVYASWQIQQYTITFVDGFGNTITSITQNYGTAITWPANPSKEGYAFSKWDKAVIPTMLAENITVTAEWTPIEYNVSFDAAGGTVTTASKNVAFGQPYGDLPTPTRPGYTFKGWATAAEGGTIVTATTVLSTAADHTLYAQWEEINYQINYDLDGGTNAAGNPATYTVNSATITLQAPSKTGYTFSHWEKDGTAVTQIAAGSTGDITLTAVWTANQYTVKFDANTGTAGTTVDDQVMTYDIEVALNKLNDRYRKTGYTFSGWNTAADGSGTAYADGATVKNLVTEGSITLYAQWDANVYTITFDSDGGSAVGSITADYGAEITWPANPTKTGYTFSHWKNSSGVKVDAQSTMPLNGLALTAVWTINQYTITFDTAGGSTIAAITQNYGTAITKPGDPTKTGYTFAGWDKEIPGTMPAESMTITAKWTINKYTITFNTDGGSEVAPITQDYGTAITKPGDPTKTGYTFAGWDVEVPTTMPAENLTITAKWTINKYTITFADTGDTAIAPITQEFGTAIAKPADPTKTGYTFAGWDTTIPDTMPAESMTITAKWTINQYTITFENTGDTTIDPITQDYGTAITKPADPKKTGYTFAGWDVDVPTTMPAENLTITAKWTINQYTITFADTGDTVINPITQNYGTAITKPANPTKAGYTFKGWSVTIPDTMPAENLTITAQWSPIRYSITFDEQGGSDVADIYADYESAITKPADPTRDGYTFTGWKNTETGLMVTDFPATMPLNGLKLEAVWDANEYTITFENTGDTTIDSITQDFETTLTLPENPTKRGYKFNGWVDADTNTPVELPETMPLDGLSLKADWEIVTYTVTFNVAGGDAVETITYTVEDDKITLPTPTRTGYTFLGWTEMVVTRSVSSSEENYAEEIAAGSVGDRMYTANWKANPDTPYKVEHYQQNLLNSEQYDLVETENLTGTTDSTVTPGVKSYTGFTSPAAEEVTILPNGSLVVKYYYTRNSYTLSWSWGTEDSERGEQVYLYGASVTAPAKPTKTGYTFGGWVDAEENSVTIPATMPAQNLTVKAKWTINTYTITFVTDGGTVIAPITDVYNTPVTAPANPVKEGYTFDGWDKEIPSTIPAEDMVITAKWKINQYKITFLDENGQVIAELAQDYGTAVVAPTREKTGHSFDGWVNSNNEKVDVLATMPAQNMTLKETWRINQYVISYYSNGGSIVFSHPVNYGAEIPVPADPGREGYTFMGWEPALPDTMPAHDLTVVAKWQINQYTITFGNTGDTTIDPITQDYGTPVTAPADPEREGYTFDGWDLYIPTTMPAGNTTINAKWKINQYTITFDTDGGNAIDAITQDYGTGVTAPANPTKTGYTFGGWVDENGESVSVPTTMPAKDMTLKAKWTINQYTITFDTVGGTAIAPITSDFGSAIGTIADPTKTGYTFKGWSAEIPETMPADDMTITASWEANQYTVTLEPGEGVLPGEKTIEVTYDQYYNLPTPTREGYAFNGWYLGEDLITNTTLVKITTNTTLTAKWKVGNPYHVQYELGENAKWPTGATVVEQFTVEESFTLLTPEREGYTFIGWTGSNGTTPQLSVTVPAGTTEDLQYTANWQINQYKITFDTDGGSAIDAITQNYGTGVTAPADPTKTGYTFAGWDMEIPATMPAKNLTITAQWTINQYTITFDTDGGSAIDAITQDYGTGVTAPADPTRTGYTFAGWDTEVPGTMPAENMTIKAQWTINQYTITFANTGDTVIDAITQNYGTDVTAPANPTKTGYTFAGWDAEIPAKMPANDVTITAKWAINQYTITFDTDGGSAIGAITQDYNTAVTAPANPTKTGYTFAGWDVNVPETMPAENLTITAQWTINQYTITFDTDGGSAIDAITQDYGTNVTAPADPTKTGYTFLGWVDQYGGSATVPETMPAENRTLKASWQINQYTITFDTDGGSAIGAITQNYNTAVTSPADPTKTGYTFAGWDAEIPAKMPAESITIKAKWTINQYTITFDTDGGSAVEQIKQDYGTDVTAPADPTKEGYTFAGWMNENGQIVLVPAKISAKDVVLTAKWTINQYTITFDTDGGSAIGAITQDYNTAVTAPANPTKTGYTFAGWDTEVPSTMPAENMTIKAKWTINQYTITFDTDGGSTIDAITQDYNTAVTSPADPTKTGYTFAGWDTEIPAKMPAENITIKAKWTINQYTITFDTDGGSAIGAITQDYGTNVTAPANPTKTGYTFAGWDTEVPSTMPAENVTIKAKWTINQYTITFDTDGGSTIDAITQDYNTAVTAPADPTKEGYTFLGWNAGIPSTMPAENLTITATWKINSYKITFVTDGGTEISPIIGDYNTAVTAPADPTKEGYTFDGWDVEIPATMPATDMIITAKWTINQYTITFDTDGGSGVDPITQDYNTAVTAPANPTKTGYTFSGWKNADGDIVAVPAMMPAKDMVLTATWTINQYTITYETDGGSTIISNPQDYQSPVVAPMPPTKEGYTFVGWLPALPATMPAEDITVVAQWQINQYTITFDTVGGSAVAPITQDYMTSVTAPADPTKKGYIFKGWDTQIPAKMPAGDMTITAIWERIDYTITFDTDGGNTVGDIIYSVESEEITLPTTTRTGYTFLNWTDSEGTVVSTIPAGSVGDLALKANWKANEDTKYCVEHYLEILYWDGQYDLPELTEELTGTTDTKVTPAVKNFEGFTAPVAQEVTIKADGTLVVKYYYTRNSYRLSWVWGTEEGDRSEITYPYGASIAAGPTPTRTGYTFEGWSEVAPSTMPASDVTINAVWNVVTYHINLNLDGGTAENETTYTVESDAITLNNPTREGYTFIGWSGTGLTGNNNMTVTIPAGSTGNRAYTANWRQNTFTIRFEGNGSTAGEMADQSFTYDVQSTLNANQFERTGYTFNGWKDADGNVYTNGQTINNLTAVDGGVITLYAQWTANTYKVYFLPNSGTGTAYSLDVTYDGEALTIPACIFSRVGYTFAGWNTMSDGSGSDYAVNDSVANLTADLRLYAQWTANTYKVVFDANGGTGSMADQEIVFDTGVSLNLNQTITKVGYSFIGWNTKEDGTGISYADGAAVRNLVASGEFKLYAQWKINQYTITFDTVGGTAINPITQDYNTGVKAPANPTRPGYRFEGWDVTIPTNMPAENITITAQWTSYLDLLMAINPDSFANADSDAAHKAVLDLARQYFNLMKQDADLLAQYKTSSEKYPERDYTYAEHCEKLFAEIKEVSLIALEESVENDTTIGNINNMLHDEETGNEIAKMEADATTNKVEVSLADEEYLALKMLGIHFLTELFKNNEIWSVDFPVLRNETDGNGNLLTPYGQGVSTLEQMELMLRIAFATINEPEITGADGKMTYQEFFDWLYAQKETLQIGVLDGTAIEVVVNAITVEGVEYYTTYYISFYNRDHQITWNPDNGENVTEETYSYGDPITAPTPVREGYTFLGWEDAEGNAPVAAMGKTDLIYTAKWKINQYTITFANTGDSVIDPITKDFGAAVTAPADPTREGYTFDGWDVEVPSTMPATDMTITAKWKANRYTITFENTGDTTIAPITQDFGTVITGPADPEKVGYTFDGWDVEIPATMPAKNLTITAKWKINSYTITFDTDGGSAIAPITGEYDTAVTMPKNPTKEGYTFAGWSMEIPEKIPAGDVTIIAQWTINQYTITIDTVGGTTIAPITGDFGSAIGKVEDPEKVGYTFKGWDVEIPEKMPAKNLTITAQWEANQYTVTLNPGEGTLPGSNTVTVTYDDYYVLPTPECAGYTFDGWYLGEEKITDTTLVEITADTELIAKWKLGNPYDVEYVLGDNAKWPTGANVVYQFTVKDSFTLPVPVREGYTFIGWTGSNGSEAQMNVTVEKGTTEDLTFTANWKVNSYTITFDTDGGSDVAPIKGDYGTDVTAPADPTKEGYTFAGWDVAVPETMPAGDMIITATWTINEYTISFDTDGGSMVAPITKDFGEAITKPADPTKEGYTFAGWDVEIPATMPAKNLTITARWTVNQYTITFDTDGGSAVGSITADFGASVTKPANPTKEGYTFAGWSVEIPATMPAKNLTIKATWTINQYTITFDTDGGTEIDPIIRNYGVAVTAPANPTKTGYTFAGWDVEIPATMPAKNLTITALWDINEYTITFVTGGGTEIRPMTQFFGSKVTAPADPTREGYTFDGWDVEIPSVMPAENLTITAKWKINSYNLIYKVDGEVIDSISLNYGSAILAKTEPTKEGYTFSGWSVIPATMPAQDVEISGTFTANRYTVHFDPNYPAASQIADVVLTFDGVYGTLPVVTRTGYTFAGWMLDGQVITAASVVKTAGEHTLTAKWTAKTYQVTLNPNQGTLPGSNTITVTFDGTYANLPVPTRTGYDFIGWFDGETQISTDTVVSITAAQTLVARWNASGDTPYHVYHYQENLNGGYDLVLQEDFKSATDTIAQATQKNYTGFTYNSGKSTASGTILADGSLVLSLYYDRMSYDIVWQVADQEIRESYKYGETLTAPNTDRADDDRASYTFTGWNVELPAEVTASATYVAQYSLDYEATIGNTTYRTLKLALATAKAGQQVVIARDVTMTEDLVVPAGVTLLIPCMDNDPGYVSRYNGKLMFNPDGTAVNGSVGVATNSTLYRKLTIPAGVTLTIDGTVMVNAVTGRPAAGHYDMDVNGGYAQIDLDGDIVVRKGGQLDSFGFVKGDGTVTAKDGGTVGDLYIVRHWRGGSQAYQMYVENIYPMNEYDCHNIEADVRVEYGGSYEGLVKMYAGGEYNYTRFPQVHVNNGLIRSAEGGYVIRTYANDRETYTIYGGAELASSALNILGVDLTSADFMYPYDGDISLNLNDGKYYIVNNYKFLPGCEVTVGGDASLTVIKGVSAIFYQEFNDVGNRGTEYPDRDPAKVIVKAGGTFTNAGTFAGYIYTESPNIWIGEGPVWTATTKEANGYYTEAQNKNEPTYVVLNHELAIERPGHTWSFGPDGSIVWDGKADYSKVQQAIASIPRDLSYYTADSIAAIQPALDQVIYDLDLSEQARVDAMADPILAAVAGLVPKTITVTFNPNGGTVTPTTMDVTCTLAFGTLPTPIREFYRFTGWYDADGNRITETSIVEENTNFTLTARWEIKKADYDIVGDALDTIPGNLSIYTDDSVAALQAAKAAIIYNLTADHQAEVDAMAQAILDAIDGLKLKPITVTFDANGGEVDPDSKEATYGETFGELPTPVREYYRFDGWYTAEGTHVTADTAVPANQNMTLTARWTLLDADYRAVETAKNKIPADLSIYTDATVNALQAAVNAVDYSLKANEQAKVDAMAQAILDAIDDLTLKTVTITFAPNGGMVDPTSKVVTLTGTYGTLPTPDRAGYRFDGWYTADGKKATEDTVVTTDENVILTAKWTMIPADYTAVEDALNRIPADLSIYTNATVEALQAAKNAVVNGLSIADQAKVDAMAQEILDAIDDLALKTVTITFAPNGGTVTPTSKVVTLTGTYGTLSTPDRAGYRFDGWYTADDKLATAETVVTTDENVTLTAKWTMIPADYTAVEDALNRIPADLSIYTNATVEALQAAKTAVEYGLSIAEQAEVNAMAQAILNAIDDLTYRKFVITFDAGYGTVTPSNKEVDYHTAYGELPVPTRTNYRFTGWVNADGAPVTAQTVLDVTKDITLTATWEALGADYTAVEDAIAKIPADLSIYTKATVDALQAAKAAVVNGLSAAEQARVDAMAKAIEDAIDGLKLKTVIITFAPNGGTVTPTSKVVTLTGTYGTLPTPDRAGYRFDGWYTADGKKATADTVVTTDENVTLTAKWTMIPADYTAVEDAIAKIPADLSIYTKATVDALQAAKAAVMNGLSAAEQARVDAMAKAIEDAIDGLKLKTVTITFAPNGGTVTPTSKVVTLTGTYGTLPTPERAGYRFDGWYTADGKKATADTVVTTDENVTLTAKWTMIPADYTAVEDAIAKIPADLSIYTAETAEAVTAAKNAVEYGLSAAEQARVDAMAKAIEDAIDGLKPTLKSIEITKEPEKLVYIQGESLKLDDMVVTAHYSDGSSKEVTGYRVSGYNANVLNLQTITITYEGKTDTFAVTVRSLVPTKITSNIYLVNTGLIHKIPEETTAEKLTSGINEKEYITIFKGNTVISGKTLVGTGMVVKLLDGTKVNDVVTVIVTGDVNGDGKITITDMIMIKSHLLKKSTLTGAAAYAADTNGDGKISITDFIQMKSHLLNKSTIQAN